MTPLQNRSTNGAVGPLCEMCGLSSAALQCLEEAEPTACPSCMWLENGLTPGKCYRGNAERSHRFPIWKVYHSPNSSMYRKKQNWFEVQKRIQIYPTTSWATEDTKPAWEEVWLKICASSPDCASGARDTQVATATVLFVRLRACQANRRCYVITVFLCNYQGWWDSCVNKRYP